MCLVESIFYRCIHVLLKYVVPLADGEGMLKVHLTYCVCYLTEYFCNVYVCNAFSQPLATNILYRAVKYNTNILYTHMYSLGDHQNHPVYPELAHALFSCGCNSSLYASIYLVQPFFSRLIFIQMTNQSKFRCNVYNSKVLISFLCL